MAVPARLEGRTVAELERAFAPARVFVERIQTPEGAVEPTPATILRANDIIALSGHLATHLATANPLAGTEVDDPDLLDIPTTTVEVVITAKEIVGRTLGEIAKTVGQEDAHRSGFLRQIRGRHPRDGARSPSACA